MTVINNLYNIYNQLDALNAADLDSFALDDVITAQRSLCSAILRQPMTTAEDVKIKAKMLKNNLEIECQTKGKMNFEDTEQKAFYEVLECFVNSIAEKAADAAEQTINKIFAVE